MSRILMNAFYSAGYRRYGGIGTYVRHLLFSLGKIDRRNEYLILAPEGLGLDLPGNFRQQALFPRETSGERYVNRMAFSRQFDGFRPDIVFQPYGDFPVSYPPHSKWVYVIHDIIPILVFSPRLFLGGEGAHRMLTSYGILLFFRLKRHLPRIASIITGSRTARDSIARVFGRQVAAKLQVIYNGVDSEMRPYEEREVAACLQRHGLAYKRYLVYFGGHTSRKNLGMAVRAYQKLSRDLKEKSPFIIVGDGYWRRWILQHGLENGLRFIPSLPDGELWQLVSGALLSVYPSLVEGFGLPVLESLKLGTLPLASDIPCMREIYGNGIPLFHPKRDRQLQGLLRRYLSEPSAAARKAAEGLAQLPEGLTWTRCAQETLATIETLAGSAWKRDATRGRFFRRSPDG